MKNLRSDNPKASARERIPANSVVLEIYKDVVNGRTAEGVE